MKISKRTEQELKNFENQIQELRLNIAKIVVQKIRMVNTAELQELIHELDCLQKDFFAWAVRAKLIFISTTIEDDILNEMLEKARIKIQS